MTTTTTEAVSPLQRNRTTQVMGRLGYRAAIEAFYEQNPTATQEQARRATGAPRVAVRKAFDAMVLAGRLSPAKAMVRRGCDDV